MDEKIFKVDNIKSNLSIVSKFILKEIFSFLKKKEYFKLIIYNKKLQNKCGYNIEDYKKLSGKYIKKDKNLGKIEIYKLDTKIKIFEGEYLNREKNGKGKEYYDNGKLNLKENI